MVKMDANMAGGFWHTACESEEGSMMYGMDGCRGAGRTRERWENEDGALGIGYGGRGGSPGRPGGDAFETAIVAATFSKPKKNIIEVNMECIQRQKVESNGRLEMGNLRLIY
jgi:hypothetical protein